MNADTLLENFENLAEAPSGIDRLRELLLHLGVSGKLLPQISTEVREEILWSRDSLRLDKHRIWGAEYLQNAPTTWPKVPLARLGSWGSGGTPTRGNKTYYDGEIPWLVIGDLNDGVVTRATNSITKKGLEESSAVIVPVGAVFVAMYGSIGKSGIAGIECATNQAIAHCVPDRKVISTEYLFLIIRAVKPRLFSQGRGLAQQNISQTVLKHLMISVPPLAEQKRIVAKVDELMALCDQLEQQQKHRDNLRTATRKSAIDAISTATTPEELETAWKRIENSWEVIADTPESVGSLRSLILDLAVRGRLQNEVVQEFDPVSGLPIGWELQRLDQVCIYLQRGKGPQYADMSKYAVVSQKCVQWSGFDISKARFVDEQSLNSYGEERILRNGDILWNSTGTGTVGRTAIYFDSNLFEKVVADSHVTVLRAPDMNPQFLWSWTASPAVQSLITDLTSGTTNQQELNLSSIKSLLVPVPPLPEQNIIVTKVEELMAICDQLESGLDVRRDVAEKFARSVVSVSGTTEFEI